MKKGVTILFLLAMIFATAQNQMAQKIKTLASQNKFTNYSLFDVDTTARTEIEKVVANSSLVTLKTANLETVYNQNKDFITIDVPYNNQIITVDLYKVNLFAEGFHIDTNKQSNIAVQKGHFYRGIIKDDYQSLVSFNIFNDECNAIISNNTLGNIVVGKLITTNNSTNYIVYSDANLKIINNFDCHVKDQTSQKQIAAVDGKNDASAKCVTMYFEIDYDLYQANNSNTTTTTNWMTSVFNNVQTLYANETITVALRSMFIWTDQDPYEGIGTSSSDYLYAFNAHTPIFDADLGQLVGVDQGSLGGVAVGINGLCNTNNFSYSDVNIQYASVPTYSWTVQVITHELGHLLGSPHTHACVWNGNNTAIDNCAPAALGSSWEGGSCMTSPATIPSSAVKGTIMSYCHLINGVGISFANGFGLQPRNLILSKISAAPCLSTDCVNTCINTVSNVSLNFVDTNSAIINFIDSTATSWQVAVYLYGDSPTVWHNASGNTYTATGLLPDTYYVAAVRPNCASPQYSNGRELIFVTAANFCNGVPFYDIGGATENYQDEQTVVRIMFPNQANKAINIAFSEFDFELDYDYLYVYDGNSTAAPLLGQFTGDVIPGPFTSSTTDGALTIKYTSDQYLNFSGFSANISCVQNLAIQNNDFIDFTYYPNPANSNVTISSRTPFESLKVYNVLGQLLYTQNKQSLETVVDILKFETGTYFFKLMFNEKEVNFKIVKR